MKILSAALHSQACSNTWFHLATHRVSNDVQNVLPENFGILLSIYPLHVINVMSYILRILDQCSAYTANYW